MAATNHQEYLSQYMRAHKGDRGQRSATSRSSLLSSTSRDYRSSSSQRSGHSASRGTSASRLTSGHSASRGTSASRQTSSDIAVRATPVQPRPKGRLPPVVIRRRKLQIQDLPDELLMLILSFLNPGDLLIVTQVGHRWWNLASDNVIWHKIYQNHVQKKEGAKPVSVPASIPHGFWKSVCVQRCSSVNVKKYLKLLKKKHPYTGLPANCKKILSAADTGWKLGLVDSQGEEHMFNSRDAFWFNMSLTIRWYDLQLPPSGQVKKLRIYAGTPLFRDSSGNPLKDSPCRYSLLLEENMNNSGATRGRPATASDDMVKVFSLPSGLVITEWKDAGSLAFILGCLHFHQLVERCLLGTKKEYYAIPLHKPVLDDLDTRYGLHSYSCTIEIRNSRQSVWSQQFLNLHCHQEHFNSGYIMLELINSDRQSAHPAFTKQPALPWKTDLFKGILQGVCIMDVTLLDERLEVIWCVSSPVTIRQKGSQDQQVTYDYAGDFFKLEYSDSMGKVTLDTVWDQDDQQYFVTSLTVGISKSHVNNWFGTHY